MLIDNGFDAITLIYLMNYNVNKYSTSYTKGVSILRNFQ